MIDIIDKGKITAVVAIDQSACFDIIPHDILIKKLRHIGFGKATIDIIESYLKKKKTVC